MIVTFLKSMRPKVGVIARLEFEPAYYDAGVHNPYHIYPTPPLRQDMTLGQFLSEV